MSSPPLHHLVIFSKVWAFKIISDFESQTPDVFTCCHLTSADESLPAARAETGNDASVQQGAPHGPVRGPPGGHGEAPVLPGVWTLLPGGEATQGLGSGQT